MDFYKRGFEFVPSVFTKDELDAIIAAIPKLDPANPKVMGGDRSYAIRSVMQCSQELHKAVWTNKLVGVIADHFGKNVFLTKSSINHPQEIGSLATIRTLAFQLNEK